MPLPSSGIMSFSQLVTEFGKTLPISLSQLYAITSGIPSSGSMSLSQFYGKTAATNVATVTMVNGSLTNAADGKYVTVANTDYGFSSGNYGSVSPTAINGIPIQNITYNAYNDGAKELIISFYIGTTSATPPMPDNFIKSIKFNNGTAIPMPTNVVSTTTTFIIVGWSPYVAGIHKGSYQDGANWTHSLAYVIRPTTVPSGFLTSGTNIVTFGL